MEIRLDFVDRGGIAVAVPLELMLSDADFTSRHLIDKSDHDDSDPALDDGYWCFDNSGLLETRRDARLRSKTDDLNGSGAYPS